MDLTSKRVLVTPTTYGKCDPRLRSDLEQRVGQVIYSPVGRPLSSVELAPLLADCDGYIAGLDEIDRAALEGAARLKVIARYGAGVDNVDLRTAASRGIVVTNTPGANAVSVAELAVGLMLALARDLPAVAAATRDGQWPRGTGATLEGKVVGLIGLGAIGKGVARRLAGFDCRILAHDLAPDERFAAQHGVRLASRDEVVAAADFLSLHVPLFPDTAGFVNADLLARMKPGAFLINTARGELIDEPALIDALTNGRLRGAALDAFRQEPPAKDHWLLSLPNVIATPHFGAHTDGAMNAMGWGALHDCLAVLSGEPPAHRVV